MAMLDKRLKRMEERVIKVIPKDELPDMSVVGRANVRPALPTTAPKSTKPPATKKRSAEDAFTKELDEWTKSRGQATLPESVLRNSQHRGTEENSLLAEGADFLPSEELQEHLAEVFFDCLYGQSYLLLHKPSFMRRLRAGNVPPVLTLAVCAISARFSSHPDVSTEPAFLRGDAWASPARAIVERRHYEPNITILTVMLILGLHYFGTCEGGLSWSFGGQAMRMAYALQLHRELDHDPLGRKHGKAAELSFTDREIRRRTMWACFLMDRFNSSGTERPPFGAEQYLRIQLPIRESYFQMEIPGPTEDLDGGVPNPITPGTGQISDPRDNMGVAAYVIRAVVLWGRVVNYLNLGGKEKDPYTCWAPESGFQALQAQIREFIESLPPLLVWSQENLQNHAAEKLANQYIYLHIICQQNILFLNRFAIPVSPGARPPRDIPKDFLTECGKLVIDSSAQISKLLDAASGHNLTAPFAGYCAYAASTVHVWGIHSKQPQLEASSRENLRHVYKYLNRMKKYWGMFHYMTESVKDIYRAFADAALKGASRPGSGNPQPMFQYGDWFDKYPHGVSRTDWEDTGPEMKKESGTEAVMSQQSELQSVEEFFASLSPPSKSDHPRKAARRNTKSAGESARNKKQPTKIDISAAQQSSVIRGAGGDASAILTHNPDLSATSLTMPDHTPVFPPDHPGSQPFPQQDFNNGNTNLPPTGTPYQAQFFNPHQLPQLDRQLVFGAYAGLDSTHANLGNLSSSGFNIWEGVDLNGMSTNPGGHSNTHGNQPAPHHHNTNGYFGGNNEASNSSAWFMPFNMDPPEIGRVGDTMGNLFGDFGIGYGSFSGPDGAGPGAGHGQDPVNAGGTGGGGGPGSTGGGTADITGQGPASLVDLDMSGLGDDGHD